MIEKYSCYEYRVKEIGRGYDYVIYEPYYVPSDASVIRESEEWYDTKLQAQCAAIGHIDLLENGAG